MKRGLVFSLCALALVAGATAAQAQTNNVDLSLNLRYTDPAAPAEGGRWFLMAQSDAAFGIAGISAYISGIDLAGITLGNGTAIGTGVAAYPVVANTLGATGLNGNVLKPDNSPFATAVTGGVNLVYGQDLATISPNVGKGAGTPGNIASDPLRNPAWNNSALIASGTFGATRPAFISVGANSTDANVFASATAGQAAVDATVTTTVRGDSVRTLGLEKPLGTPNAGLIPGDANRDGLVNVAGDGFIFSANIGLPNRTWDQGDFNNSGTVTVNPDGFTLSANFGQSFVPPAIGAVPEPTSMFLALAGVAALAAARRQK